MSKLIIVIFLPSAGVRVSQLLISRQKRLRPMGEAESPVPKKAFRPGWLAKWVAVVIVLAACARLCPPLHTVAAERNEAVDLADMAVTVAQTKNMCFDDTLQVTGTLVPRNEILVRPDREGLQISQVLVEVGDVVVAGQVLARLTPLGGQQDVGTVALQAPAAGIIISGFAIIGAAVSARADPTFRIAAKGEMELLAETTIQTLARLAPDLNAKLEIIGVGELPGRVRLVSTTINPTTQLGQVRLLIGADARLHVGAFGRAMINVGRRCGAAVPLSAVLYGTEGAVVQVVRDNRIETRRVRVGLLAGGQAEIREGLSERDTVVIRAGTFLREGDRIRPVAADDPAGRR